MKKTKLLFVLAFCVPATATFAETIPDNVAEADNACALIATNILTGMRSQLISIPTAIALCNAHPQKGACESTKSFIRENNGGKVPPELTCR